jgi:single-stranded DNA-binding protein
MDYQRIILVGNASADASLRKSKNGEVSFAAFNVGVKNSKEHTIFFPVVAFGKLGETLVTHINRGRQILVEGSIEISPTGRFNIVADRVRLGSLPKETNTTEKVA